MDLTFKEAEAKGSFYDPSIAGEDPDLHDLAAKFEAKLLSDDPTGYMTDADVPKKDSNQSPEKDTNQSPLPWNLHVIPDCILRRHLPDTPVPVIAGLNTPLYYIGEKGLAFTMHVEDDSLNAISILRYGAPKLWYAPIPRHREKFERLVSEPNISCYVQITNRGPQLFTFCV